MPYIKKGAQTEIGRKIEMLAEKAPLKEWWMPDPYNPATYMMPLGMPFYRIEVASHGGWRGPFSRAKKLSKEIENMITSLGAQSQSPGSKIRTLFWDNPNLRFAYTEKAMPPERLNLIRELAQKHPEEIRLISLPEKVGKRALYSDPEQIAIPIRQIFKSSPKR